MISLKNKVNRMGEYLFLFWFGGSVYIEIELLYRGFTHWSMFLLAGFIFVTVGLLNEIFFEWNEMFWGQVFVSTLWATVLEYICGLMLRLCGLQVWDYSDMPLNINGLICVPFMLVWAVLMAVAIVVDDCLKYGFFDGERPHYHIGKHCVKLFPLKVN